MHSNASLQLCLDQLSGVHRSSRGAQVPSNPTTYRPLQTVVTPVRCALAGRRRGAGGCNRCRVGAANWGCCAGHPTHGHEWVGAGGVRCCRERARSLAAGWQLCQQGACPQVGAGFGCVKCRRCMGAELHLLMHLPSAPGNRVSGRQQAPRVGHGLEPAGGWYCRQPKP